MNIPSLSRRDGLRRTPLLLALAPLVALAFGACSKPETTTSMPENATATAEAKLETIDQRASYAIAYNVGTNISRQGGLEIDSAAFMAGLADALAEADPRIDEAQMQQVFTELAQRAQSADSEKAQANRVAAETFLAQNKTRAGVVTTASGLQYEVLSSGSGGTKPTRTDTVEVHYHGTLPDGTVFDSSVERGATIEFPVSGVIAGWTEALQLMSPGDKWKLFIPPALGYGDRAAGKIPPGSALVFEVELIGVK
ncbi:FKBP-type peptidyl-prolyl cis-trans isomerase [Opitutales bacterium ASA1]|uniref:FKBP-type peptidyl-prolyl cis-trans isomerase n=1 Tax=Congregicoccus parvus TaxID=3081749 RepID=UPI002B28B289|nr:FKBP-type peptidyl-prolyl cis-trans isomerase [Opitutales bacterium ASA1]